MTSADVLIIGAGPAGLAARVALACHRPDLSVRVVDPAGRWMRCWVQQFAAQAIPHLRSPAVHHPHPYPFALHESVGTGGLVPYEGNRLPATEAFAHFCRRLIEMVGCQDEVIAGRAWAIGPVHDRHAVTVRTPTGASTLTAQRVVVATNARSANVPDWAVGTPPEVRHSSHVDLRSAPSGGRVLVVGGGMSAGHLAAGAARLGNRVVLAPRRRLRIRSFDTHPGWIGPRFLKGFEAEPDPARRRRRIDEARGGGSIPAWLDRILHEHIERRCLEVREGARVAGVEPVGETVRVRFGDGRSERVDEVWCATGTRLDVETDPLLGGLRATAPIPVHDGLPLLDEDLSWPGTRVHLVGHAAALRLGPTAGNLIGQRRAAARVIASLTGRDPATVDLVPSNRQTWTAFLDRARPCAAGDVPTGSC